MQSMSKRIIATLLLSLGIVVMVSGQSDDKRSVADTDLIAWVNQRVKDRQPTDADHQFDRIGWFKDIRTAEKLAQKHNRPLFLFTHDGRMNVGRC